MSDVDRTQESSSELKRYYTEEQFCALMGIGKRTAFRWREERVIGFIRTPGGQIRYLARHIEEFERQNEVKKRGKAA